MIRRIVTQLILTSLVPMAIRAAKKLFSKKKSAKVKANGQRDNLTQSSNDEFIERGDVTDAPQLDVTDKGIS